MVFTQYLLASGCQAKFVHSIQYSPMDRLETVPHIRQGTRHDNGHRIVDIRCLHLRLDIHLHYPALIYFFIFHLIMYFQNKTLKYEIFFKY